MTEYTVAKNFSTTKYTDEKLHVLADTVINMMTNNPDFPTPAPTLEALSTANTAFAEAIDNAVHGTPQQTAIKKENRKVLAKLLKKLAMYVETTSDGIESIILGSGFYVNPKPTAVGQLPKASYLVVTVGPKKGSVVLSCDIIKNARMYEFKYTDAPATDDSVWTIVSSSRHKLQINGLTSGHEYTFSVAGAGSDLARNWSDQISSFVV